MILRMMFADIFDPCEVVPSKMLFERSRVRLTQVAAQVPAQRSMIIDGDFSHHRV